MAGRPPAGAAPRAEVILDAARAVFLEHGYATATVDEIARRARASKATLYRRYPDKSVLLDAVVRDIVDRNRPDATALTAVDAAPGIVLRGFAHALLGALSAPESLGMFRLVIAESGRHPSIGRIFHDRITGAGAEVLAGYLDRQRAQGALTVTDPRRSALQFLGLLKEVLFWPRLFAADPTEPVDEVVTEAVRTFLVAHRAPVQTSSGRALDDPELPPTPDSP